MPFYRALVCVLIIFNSCLANDDQPGEEHIAKVLDDLHYLLNQNDPITIDDIDYHFNQIDDILVLEQDVVFPGELLQLLTELGEKVDLKGSFVASTIRDNIALLIADSTPANPILGMALARKEGDIFTEESVKILDAIASPDVVLANVSEMVVLLPTSVGRQPRRISFLIFRDGHVFDSDELNFVNSRVVSVNIQNHTDFGHNEKILFYGETKVENMDNNVNNGCAYWQFLEDGTGYWSEEACRLVINPPQLDICHCNPQTFAYFARLTIPEATITPKTTVTIKTTLSPQEQIQNVLENIQLLLDQTDTIMVDDITQVIDQVNNILRFVEDDLEFPGALLQLIDELGAKVDLNRSHTEAVVRENIALLIADVTPENPVQGIALANRDTDFFTEDSFNFLTSINSSILSTNVSEAVVFLSLSVTWNPRRISFVVFRDGHALGYDRELYAVNSRVISINIDNFAGPEQHEVVDIYLRPIIEPKRKKLRTCAFWNDFEDKTGHWSQEGCTFIRSSDPWMLDNCRCDHPSHVAEVLIPNHAFSQHNDIVLTSLAVFGCVLSIFGLIVIALTAVLFKSWRKNFRNQIWLQLSVALFLICICYLLAIFVRFDDFSVPCMLTGIVLHFSIIASYCWMLTGGFKALAELYLSPNKKLGLWAMLLASGFSWGIPILKIVLLAFSSAFMEPFEDMHPMSKFCKPAGTNLWLTFFTPTAVLMIASWIVFFFVIYKLDIGPSSRNEEITDSNRDTLAYARVGLGLVVIAGLPPWIFGLFNKNIVGAYFHACTSTTQGFILFLFIVCCNVPTRNLWLQKLNLRSPQDMTPLTRPSSVHS